MSAFIPQNSISAQDRFIKIYTTNISRAGAEEFLNYLHTTDFFSAPASTRFHLASEGGLVLHSLHVYDRLQSLCEQEAGHRGFVCPSSESIAICGLLHDICKANFYAVEMRNRKTETGEWVQVPFYTVRDQFPYGHGEKSVQLISKYLNLSDDEAIAIRWHMGGFDDAVKGGSYSLSRAYELYPLALMLHLADMQATYLDEVR